MNVNSWFNSPNRHSTTAIQIPNGPNSPRNGPPSPNIPISPHGDYGTPNTSERIAYSLTRERAPSLLVERLEEDLRREAESQSDENSRSSFSSSHSNEENLIFKDVDSDDQTELPFEFESEDENIVPQQQQQQQQQQQLQQFMSLVLYMQRSNHPAIANIAFYDCLIYLQQKNLALHNELHEYFSSSGPAI